MKAGMNVARFNFSHADYEKDKARFALVDKVRTELDLPVATMLDTKGPEILLCHYGGSSPRDIREHRSSRGSGSKIIQRSMKI